MYNHLIMDSKNAGRSGISWNSAVALVLLSLIAGLTLYHFSFNRNDFNYNELLSKLSAGSEFTKYFGDGLQSLTNLDTDSDGTPDVKDDDIDNDNIVNAKDDDMDGDGTPNSADPSTALIEMLKLAGLTEPAQGAKGEKGEKGKDGKDGKNLISNNDGSDNSATIGFTDDDGTEDTSLTGPELDVQLIISENSGLVALSNKLSLRVDCNSGQVLKWNGLSWDCSSDNLGITYSAGSGISISGGVISSVLGTSISTSEIASRAVDGTKLFLGDESSGSLTYYNGTRWVSLSKGSANQILSMNSGGSGLEWADPASADAPVYGENNSIVDGGTISTSGGDVPGSTFTLPSAGVWKVQYIVYYALDALLQFGLAIYDSSNTLVPNTGSGSDGYIANQPFGMLTNTVFITTTESTDYKLRGKSDSAATATIFNNYSFGGSRTGNSKVLWEKVE